MRREGEEEEETPPALTWHISLSTLHVTRPWQLEQRIQSLTGEQSWSWEPASQPSRFKQRLDPGASSTQGPTQGPNWRARRNWRSSMKYEFWRKLPRMMHCRYSVFQVQQSLIGSASTCGFNKFLTAHLFFATASPLAVAQMQDLFASLRQNEKLLPFVWPRTVGGILKSLDALGCSTLKSHFLTRYNLATLVNNYTKAINMNVHHSSQSFMDSEMLSSLIANDFPYLSQDGPEFQKQVSNLWNKLYLGRNWYQMAKQFGIGILALVPFNGEFEIHDYWWVWTA